jgi:hypothetical protein
VPQDVQRVSALAPEVRDGSITKFDKSNAVRAAAVTYTPAAIIGGSISLTGIIMGNVAIGKMMNAYQDRQSERSEAGEMFMTGEVANPRNLRSEAGKWYRETYPGGPLLKMLRSGQALTVTGFLVMFALLAI